jgi:hypothetical protein
MATYLQGVTDYIPQIQPFQPDFNFYQNLLEAKQAQYQAGYSKVSSLYGSLLNSRLTRQDTTEARDDYFTRIQNDIEKYSGMDLSKIENVNNALQVFQPLLDDRYLQRDMVFSKAMDIQRGRSNYFKNCMNEKECGGRWWDVGDSALSYLEQDFMKSSKDEIFNIQNPEYVPYTNAYKVAMDNIYKYKDMFNMEYPSLTENGRYKIITANGEQLIPTLESYLSMTIGKDPQIRRMYETQSFVDRKSYVASKAPEMGEEAAEREYINSVFADVDTYNKSLQQSLTQDLKDVEDKKTLKKSNADTYGVDPDIDGDIMEQLFGLDEQKKVVEQAKTDADNVTALTDPSVNEGVSLDVLRRRADYLKSELYSAETIGKAARDYAMSTKKVKMDADPYALADHNHALRIAEMDYEDKLTRKRNEDEEKMIRELMASNGNGTVLQVGKGNTDPNMIADAALQEKISQIQNATGEVSTDVFQSIFNSLDQKYKTASTEAERQAAAAQIEKIFGVGEFKDEEIGNYEENLLQDWDELDPAAKAEFGNSFENYKNGVTPGGNWFDYARNKVGSWGRKATDWVQAGFETAYDWAVGDENPHKTVTVKGGYVTKDANGQYTFNANQEKRQDPTDASYYKTTMERVKAFRNSSDFKDLYYAAEGQMGAAYDAEIKKYNDNSALEDKYNEARKYNLNYIVDNLKADDWRFGLLINPNNGWQVTKDEFIDNYVNAYAGKRALYKEGDIIPEMYTTQELTNDAKDVYDDLNDVLWKASTSGRFNKYLKTDINPMGGTSAQSYAGMNYNVDPMLGASSNENLLAINAIQTDVMRALEYPYEMNAVFVKGSGADIMASDLENIDDAGQESVKQAMTQLIDDFMNSSKKGSKGKDDRPAFRMQAYNVGANDANKVAVTFIPNTGYLNARAGKPTKTVWDGMFSSDGETVTNPTGAITMIFDKNSANSQMFNQFKLTGDEAALNLTGSIMVGNPNSRYGHYEIRQTNNGARYLYDNTKVLQDGKYVSANPGGVYGPEIYPQLGPGGNISDLVAALNQNIMQFAQFDDQQVNARRKK